MGLAMPLAWDQRITVTSGHAWELATMVENGLEVPPDMKQGGWSLRSSKATLFGIAKFIKS